MWLDFFSLLLPVLSVIPIGMTVIYFSEYHEDTDAGFAL